MKTAIKEDAVKERLDFARNNILPVMVPILLAEYGKATPPDEKADDACVEKIQERFPFDSILTEERDTVDANITGTNEYQWVIDPLDSTYNYEKQIPLYTISIALKKNGRLESGLVYHPPTDTLYHCQREAGAFMNNALIHVTPISKLGSARVSLVHDMPYENHDMTGLKQKLEQKIRRPEKWACTSLELANVASGLTDGFVKPSDNPWGVSAGLLLVKAAGGKVTSYRKKGSNARIHVASNPFIHDKLCRIVDDYVKA
ncbi:hypothetical protein GF343_03180 [Candidatus Woesearchaeota archaeon]|nr:hypothetical protein [Candidatus Woesearchaeota archaeon]